MGWGAGQGRGYAVLVYSICLYRLHGLSNFKVISEYQLKDTLCTVPMYLLKYILYIYIQHSQTVQYIALVSQPSVGLGFHTKLVWSGLASSLGKVVLRIYKPI